MRDALILTALLMLSALPAAPQPQSAGPPDPAAVRADFLRVIDRPRVALQPTSPVISEVNGYIQELLSIASAEGERVPVLVLKKGAATGRRPVIVALHGTNNSKESMRGLLERYVDRGFIGVAIDAPHHGERALPIPGLANPYQSAMLRAFHTGEGQPYLYDTVWDVMRLIDYLTSRPDVDPERIGLIGHSKGGTEAYLAAAADERIAAVVPLIGVQSYGWSLRRPSGWEARTWSIRESVEAAAADSGVAVNANFMRRFYNRLTPGLVDRFDAPAILPLIAPRPMMIINGDSDPRSPLAGVGESVAAAERAYVAAGAADRLYFLLEEGAAHEVTEDAQQAAIEWFVRWLAPER